jgi:branched-chain amino acid transport system substrate-binding protein
MRHVPTLAAGLLVLALAACGGDDDSDATTPEPSTGQSPATDATEPATEPSAASESTDATAAPDAAEPTAADPSLEPVRVGLVNMDSGSPSYPGIAEGFAAGVAYVNAELGGIDGHPLEVVSCSVAGDAETSQRCGQELANDSSVVLVVAGINFTPGPLYSALEASGTAIIGRVPPTPADSTPANLFNYGTGGVGANVGGAQILVQRFGDEVDFVGLLTDDSSGGRQGSETAEAVFNEAGIDTIRAFVDAATPDVAAALATFPDDIDAIYTNLTQPAQCLQLVQDPGLLPDDLLMFGTSSCINAAVYGQFPGSQDGWIYASSDLTASIGKGFRDDLDLFIEQWPEYGGKPVEEAQRFAESYWGMALTAETVLEGVGVDNLSQASVFEAARTFPGPVNLGSAVVSCPGPAEHPAICVRDTYAWTVSGTQVVPAFPDNAVDVFTD